MRDTTVDRPVDQSHFECKKCPLESHFKRKVLHFSLTQAIEITQCVSPSFKRKSTEAKTAADEERRIEAEKSEEPRGRGPHEDRQARGCAIRRARPKGPAQLHRS